MKIEIVPNPFTGNVNVNWEYNDLIGTITFNKEQTIQTLLDSTFKSISNSLVNQIRKEFYGEQAISNIS